MQTQFLNRFAPSSLYLLYQAADTGNPNHDFNIHLEKFSNSREKRITRRSNSDVSATNDQKLYSGNITRIDLE